MQHKICYINAYIFCVYASNICAIQLKICTLLHKIYIVLHKICTVLHKIWNVLHETCKVRHKVSAVLHKICKYYVSIYASQHMHFELHICKYAYKCHLHIVTTLHIIIRFLKVWTCIYAAYFKLVLWMQETHIYTCSFNM